MKYSMGYLDVLTAPVFVDEDESYDYRSRFGASTTTGVDIDDDDDDDSDKTSSSKQKPKHSNQITVVEGANASLSCKASGRPKPTILWRREDGNQIDIKSTSSQLVEQYQTYEGQSLHLLSVSRIHSGAYLCIASNGVMPSASKRIVLDVQFAPILRSGQQEVGVVLGKDAQLHCHVEANPRGSYSWHRLLPQTLSSKNGRINNTTGELLDNNDETTSTANNSNFIETRELANSDKHEIVIKESGDGRVQLTLIIKTINKLDFGNYSCLAHNPLGVQSNIVKVFEAASFLGSMFGSSSSSSSSSSRQQQDSNPGISRQRGLPVPLLTQTNEKQRNLPRSSLSTDTNFEQFSRKQAKSNSNSSISSMIQQIILLYSLMITLSCFQRLL